MSETTTTILPARLAVPPKGPKSIWFGPELRQLREARHLTLLQAGTEMGMYGSSLARLELGQRGALKKAVKAIEAFYGVVVEASEEKKFAPVVSKKNFQLEINSLQ